jgi:hypothetical protein
VYRDYTLPRAALERIVKAGRRAALPLLGTLDADHTPELDKRAARRLAEEASQLRTAATLLELDDDLTAIAEVANWCARSRENAWLRIQSV